MFNESVSRSISKEEKVPKYVIKLERDFIVGEPLGEGGFAQIVKAQHKLDNNVYAIKIIKFDSDIDDLTETEREVKNLSQLYHKNIVRYYNSWIEIARLPLRLKNSLDEKSLVSEIKILGDKGLFVSEPEEEIENEENWELAKYLFIQMELCEKKTLRSAINEDLHLNEDQIAKYFTEICEGLLHIHQHNIVHRDIKPENIFLTAKNEVKIGDFGLSKQISKFKPEQSWSCHEVIPGKELPCGSLTDVCGTPMYIAPELYNRTTFNIKADIYSLGITYFEMCCQPIKTHMEKSQMFPLNSQKLKTIKFNKNNAKKKFLLRKLVHLNDNERPTCEQILDIVKSAKSVKEINEMIQQNKKIPRNHFKTFEKIMKSNNSENIDLITFLTSTATKIFEQHGAQNIQMPTFLPSFSNYSDNLITLLNKRGKSSSVSNTSRIAFSYYVATNNIKNIRRYCIGKVFEEGYFSPNEYQECIFQAISSEPEDNVMDAEVLFISKKLLETIFPSKQQNIVFCINHSFIFSTILKYCKITEKHAAIFTNIMLNFCNKSTTDEDMRSTILSAELDSRILDSMKEMKTATSITQFEEKIFALTKTKSKHLVSVFKRLKNIIKYAQEFGIDAEQIHLDPFLINRRQNSGFMFRIVLEEQSVLATGGRFESLIKMCRTTQGSKQNSKISAIDVSFNVENIIKLLTTDDKPSAVVDVVLRAKEKSTVISAYKSLLARGLKCTLVTTQVSYADISRLNPVVVIDFGDENVARIMVAMGLHKNWRLTQVADCKWTQNGFVDYVVAVVGRFKF
ncbi:hypothetical protein Zmor_010439 [Zophobas morio]|uniref:Protein kinase domain-containing protein n=2 Tax=Zophobas morio TaxID=2755281 RepID=A0AA38IPH4_9CUCU|nr:hypothetical protein Zmor_010439 [Zophobas morio]